MSSSDRNTTHTGIRPVGFFDGPGFPAFVFAALLVYEVFIVLILASPPGDTGWGRFAQEFRIWCFNYDPHSGFLEWASVGVMLAEPLSVALIVGFVWRQALRDFRRAATWRATWPQWCGGALLTLVVAAGLVFYGQPKPEVLLPFPGERIRTHLATPVFQLVDQRGAAVSLADYRGRPVLITGIYALCTTSCPQILQQVKRTLDALPAEVRNELAVLAISLNPEYDTTELMGAIAEGYGFTYPQFRYINGEPAVVNRVLEHLQFARIRNQVSGQIEHANLFVLVDHRGEVAYRFNLNPRHEPWLHAAIEQLAAESQADRATPPGAN